DHAVVRRGPGLPGAAAGVAGGEAAAMTAWKRMEVAGWGRVPRVLAEIARPERDTELDRIVAAKTGPLLAMGAGRSYGDAGQPAAGGRGLLTTRLDRVLAF